MSYEFVAGVSFGFGLGLLFRLILDTLGPKIYNKWFDWKQRRKHDKEWLRHVKTLGDKDDYYYKMHKDDKVKPFVSIKDSGDKK